MCARQRSRRVITIYVHGKVQTVLLLFGFFFCLRFSDELRFFVCVVLLLALFPTHVVVARYHLQARTVLSA